MKIRLSILACIALTLAVFAGLQGGKYFMHNRTQELGIAIICGLFLSASFFSAFRMRSGQWMLWTTVGPGFVLLVTTVWSATFSLKANTALMPSFFASREFFLILLAPTLYMLYRSGLSLAQIQKSIVTAMVLVTLSYLFFYFTLDLKQTYLSDDPFTHHLVTYDESRGFRLKPPTYSVMLLALTSIFTLFSPARPTMKLLATVGVALAVYIWTLVSLRAVAAGFLVALMFYPVLWRRASNLVAVVVAIPLLPILMYFVLGPMLTYMQQAHGGEVRLEAYQLAFVEIESNWLLGWGQSSGFSKTYQDLFGPKFFPSDLGIVGILFKYGVAGGLIYAIACPLILFKAVRAHWMRIMIDGAPAPLFQAFVVFMTTMLLNVILWPGLAYGQGLTAAAMIIGLSACVMHEFRGKHPRREGIAGTRTPTEALSVP